ncbi:MAG: CBS domain-containing protein [Thermoanaerobaculia bacterium]|nr:MAG: CBS domain-containing protein [Thermoanaerobaculia bacterium]
MNERLARALRPLRLAARRVDYFLARRFALSTREDRIFFVSIPAVGVVAGLLGVLVHRTIDLVRSLLWGYWPDLVNAAERAGAARVLGATGIGGLLIALVVLWAREPVGGRGMSSLIEAVALNGGRVPLKATAQSALAAIFTVGAGGSLGREGPMIRLGAAVSSWIGRRTGLPPFRVKILVGCGAAAGFAAAYNVPIGGSLFAMEVILGSFALEIFGPIVVAAVISTLIARAAEDNTPIYALPDYVLESPWEILAYLGLGIVGALAAVVFTLGVRAVAKLFQRLRLPIALRPVLGMMALGALALAVPQAIGSGFPTIREALSGNLPLAMLLLLPAVKLLATALTLGSGGSGGLFTPSLFFGALVGGAYGAGVDSLAPGVTSSYGAYAAVGMAAVAAGSSHAPLSAILMLFEFTGNYELVLPLMIAAITSSWIARRLYPYSVYTEPLQRRGVELAFRMEEAALAGLRVDALARPDPETLRPDTSYAEVVEKFLATRRQRLFVVDAERQLRGAVSLHDIKHALRVEEHLRTVNAHDLMVPVTTTLAGDERLHRAAETLARSDFERLPVLDAGGRFLGVLAKRDLLAVYAQEVLGRPAVLSTFVASDQQGAGGNAVELPPDFALRSVAAPADLDGLTLAEAALPSRLGLRVIEIKRPAADGWEWIVPDAGTVLGRGDQLVVLGPTRAVEALVAGGGGFDPSATLPGLRDPSRR